MENLTWEKMVEMEPRLQDVYDRVVAARPRSEFKANQLWYGVNPGEDGFKRIMMKLVGYRRIDPRNEQGVLTSNTAYDIAYRKLYDTLISAAHVEFDDNEMAEDRAGWIQNDSYGEFKEPWYLQALREREDITHTAEE